MFTTLMIDVDFCSQFLVCLPSSESAELYKYEGRSATLLGWGGDQNLTPKLRRSPATIYDNG